MGIAERITQGGVGDVNPENIVNKITSDKSTWDAVTTCIIGVLKSKKDEERRWQANQQEGR